MNLRSLEIFQCVCQEGNITKAAQKLYMSQPAVSHAISDLEKEIQVQLFDRYGKRIFLNDTGKMFLQRVERVLYSYEELVCHLPLLEEETTIRIGSSITIANDRLPSVIKEFKQHYPQLIVQVVVESAGNVLQRLKQHSIDIALVEGLIQNENWEKILFSAYELFVICAKTNPLAQHEELVWSEVNKYQWLLREKGSSARDTFDSACHLESIQIDPLWTSVNSQALLQAVRNDLGITILPAFIYDTCPFQEELHRMRIKGTPLFNENHIVYDSGVYLSAPMKDLITMLKG